MPSMLWKVVGRGSVEPPRLILWKAGARGSIKVTDRWLLKKPWVVQISNSEPKAFTNEGQVKSIGLRFMRVSCVWKYFQTQAGNTTQGPPKSK